MGEKQQITNVLDGGILFNDIDSVIADLQKIKADNPDALEIYTQEHWTGYEDVEFQVCIVRCETDEELEEREAFEERQRKHEAERQKKEREQKKARLKELNKKHKQEREKLERELGL